MILGHKGRWQVRPPLGWPSLGREVRVCLGTSGGTPGCVVIPVRGRKRSGSPGRAFPGARDQG